MSLDLLSKSLFLVSVIYVCKINLRHTHPYESASDDSSHSNPLLLQTNELPYSHDAFSRSTRVLLNLDIRTLNNKCD